MMMGSNGKLGLRLTKADYRRRVEWHGSEARYVFHTYLYPANEHVYPQHLEINLHM